jgi:hypothetical protein
LILGVCNDGTKICQGNGDYTECFPNIQVGEQLEICNDGLDNDCDGRKDMFDICYEPGTCNDEIQNQNEVCIDVGGICGNEESSEEICNDELDNDCDGQIDSLDSDCINNQEECSSTSTQICSTGLLGICSDGTKTCDSSGSWQNCIQNIQEETEICNDELDNDCDGQIDEADCKEEDLIVTSPVNCQINYVSWSQDSFGENYLLKIDSEGDCDGAEIEFRIYEEDVIINDPIRTQFSTFNNGVGDLLIELPREEIAKVADGLFEGDQFEVVFKAVVRYTNQKWVKSGILQI